MLGKMFLVVFLLLLINYGNSNFDSPKNLNTDGDYRIPENHTTVFVKRFFETIEIQSSPNFSSQITLLNKNYSLQSLPCIQISNIRSNIINGNFVFQNAANNDEIFVLNGSVTSSWKNLIFLTPALNIIVPPKSEIIFTVSDKCDALYSTLGLHKGIISLPKNNGFDAVMKEINVKSNKNVTAKFAVKNLIGGDALNLKNNGIRQRMNNGSKITENGTEFHIFYASSNPKSDEFFIEYEINCGVTCKCVSFIFICVILICGFGFYC